MSGIKSFVKQNPVMCVALLAAAATACFVPPDREYLSYFDFRTLTCLFCVLAVVCALKNIQFFYLLARKVVERFGNLRRAIIALVYMVPVVLFLLGYFIAGAFFGVGGQYTAAVLAGVLGLIPAVLYDRRLRRRGLRPILPSAPASKKEPPFSSPFPAPLTPAAPR